jgi:electron transfer flavoprotein alpha subunit
VSAAGDTRGADTAAARGLLVAVEPAGDGGGPAGTALVSEGARLARELGVELRVVTWPADHDAALEPLAAALADLAGRTGPVALLLADTDAGRQLAPMVAHQLGSGAVVGCSDVQVREGPPRTDGAGRPADHEAAGPRTLAFVKPVYGGWLESEVDPLPGVVPVATLDLGGMDAPVSAADEAPALEVLEIKTQTPPRVRRLERAAPDARSVDLVHAKRIVAAGSGSATENLLAAVAELADLLEGSVGATRPVVDDGRLPKERLIGQTGRTVTPDLYLALGISGSPHHVAGVRKADRILSINRDVRAPIFQFSDVGYVADLEVVLPALVQKIKEWRDAPGSPDEPR